MKRNYGVFARYQENQPPPPPTAERPFGEDDLVFVDGQNWNVAEEEAAGMVAVENDHGTRVYPHGAVVLLCPWYVDIWAEAEEAGITDVGTPEGREWCRRRYGVGGSEWAEGSTGS